MQERIRAVRKSENMTQEEFAAALGLSKNYIWQVEKGDRKLSERGLSDICRIFEINYEWLVYGNGEMRCNDDSDIQAMIDSIIQSDNVFAKKTLMAFAKLDVEEWKLIAKIVREITK